MDLLNFISEKEITQFGCGCNKGKVANAVNPATRKVTMYEVHNTEGVVETFTTLADARKKAVEVSGRVKITNKTTSN